MQRFAQDVVAPKVREMDENEMMDKDVIEGLFEQGVRLISSFLLLATSHDMSLQLMGIETSADLGGAESTFTSAIIAIEELAKVDPSVSVMCDVHNTLVNTVLRKYGTKEQQDKWLPQLAESKVYDPITHFTTPLLTVYTSSEASVSLNLPLAQMHLRFKPEPRKMATTGL